MGEWSYVLFWAVPLLFVAGMLHFIRRVSSAMRAFSDPEKLAETLRETVEQAKRESGVQGVDTPIDVRVEVQGMRPAEISSETHRHFFVQRSAVRPASGLAQLGWVALGMLLASGAWLFFR